MSEDVTTAATAGSATTVSASTVSATTGSATTVPEQVSQEIEDILEALRDVVDPEKK